MSEQVYIVSAENMKNLLVATGKMKQEENLPPPEQMQGFLYKTVLTEEMFGGGGKVEYKADRNEFIVPTAVFNELKKSAISKIDPKVLDALAEDIGDGLWEIHQKAMKQVSAHPDISVQQQPHGMTINLKNHNVVPLKRKTDEERFEGIDIKAGNYLDFILNRSTNIFVTMGGGSDDEKHYRFRVNQEGEAEKHLSKAEQETLKKEAIKTLKDAGTWTKEQVVANTRAYLEHEMISSYAYNHSSYSNYHTVGFEEGLTDMGKRKAEAEKLPISEILHGPIRDFDEAKDLSTALQGAASDAINIRNKEGGFDYKMSKKVQEFLDKAKPDVPLEQFVGEPASLTAPPTPPSKPLRESSREGRQARNL